MSTARIPFEEVILRSDEFRPTEFRVLCYLYGRRNSKSGRCDPKRSTIATDLNIHKSHVSAALTALEAKGWIKAGIGRNFDLTIPVTGRRPTLPFAGKKRVKKVAESATIPAPEKVAESVTFEDSKSSGFLQESSEFLQKGSGIRYSEADAHILLARASLNSEEQCKNNEERAPAEKNDSQNGDKKRSKNTRGTRIPEPFILTAEMRAYAAERRPGLNVIEETEKFTNHFRSAPGQKGVKLNWRLTWNTWILRAEHFNNGNTRTNHIDARERSAQRGHSQRVGFKEMAAEAERKIAAERSGARALLGEGGHDPDQNVEPSEP